MTVAILSLQLFATLAMVGVIWFVQVVHYPLLERVGDDGFPEYERLHQRKTTIIVAPLMLVELATSLALLWLRPDPIPTTAMILGVALVGVLWASTFFLQVPAHSRLASAFDRTAHRRLVRSNWLRTSVWSARGVLVCWMYFEFLSR